MYISHQAMENTASTCINLRQIFHKLVRKHMVYSGTEALYLRIPRSGSHMHPEYSAHRCNPLQQKLFYSLLFSHNEILTEYILQQDKCTSSPPDFYMPESLLTKRGMTYHHEANLLKKINF